MGLKVKILSVGKTKEKWLIEAFNEYIKRLKPWVEVICIWAKDLRQLELWTQKESDYIALDPAGRSFTSEGFALFLQEQWIEEGSCLSFVIGGAEGLGPVIKQRGKLISLSPMTFTHQAARFLLIEQIYRSIEMSKNSNYHK